VTYRLEIKEFGIPDKGPSSLEFETLGDVSDFFRMLTNGADAPTVKAQVFQDDELLFDVIKTNLNTYRFVYAG
jgi:hypothetical protein